MESIIDFLRFRLFEREDFIALSTVDLQGRFQAAMLSPPGGDCQSLSQTAVAGVTGMPSGSAAAHGGKALPYRGADQEYWRGSASTLDAEA
jgi:hypothetical protein